MKRSVPFALLALTIFLFSFTSVLPAQAADPPNTNYKSLSFFQVSPFTLPPAFAANGPCYGMSSCVLENYAVRSNTINMIMNGRRWVWSTKDRKFTSKAVLLTSISRFKNGPCADQGAAICQFKSYFFYVNAQGITREGAEAVMSNGWVSYWIWDLNSHAVIYHETYCYSTLCFTPAGSKPRP